MRRHSLKWCFTPPAHRQVFFFLFFKHPHPPFISRPLTSHRNVASRQSDLDSAVMKRNHLQQEQRFLHFFHLLCAHFFSPARPYWNPCMTSHPLMSMSAFICFSSQPARAFSTPPPSTPLYLPAPNLISPTSPRAGARPGWAVANGINRVTHT